jgi:hypothetical protein
MTAYRSLIVAGTASGAPSVTIPVHGSTELTQTYTDLRAQTLYRYLNGGAAVRRSWSGKVRTEVQGRGLVPAGLSAVCSATGAVVISCVGHRSVRSSGNVITIPAARRSDLTITTKAGTTATGKSWYARTWDGDIYATATGTTASGTGHNVVTITLATGETHAGYEVIYLPKIVGYAELSAEGYQQNDGFNWSLVVEEA